MMRCYCFFILIVASGSVSAAAPSAWYNQTTLTYVYSGHAGNRVAIKVSSPIDIGTCSSDEMELDQNNPFFKSMFAMIMAAYAAGKTISVYTDGACTVRGVALKDVRLP